MRMDYEESKEVLKLLQLRTEAVKRIEAAVKRQMDCFDTEVMDDEGFEQQQIIIDEYIDKISQWNQQFETVYPMAKIQIKKMIAENGELAQLIQQKTTELDQASIELRRSEECLRILFEEYLADAYKKIGEQSTRSKKAAVYYKNMIGQNDTMSYFYDQKN